LTRRRTDSTINAQTAEDAEHIQVWYVGSGFSRIKTRIQRRDRRENMVRGEQIQDVGQSLRKATPATIGISANR
jgi:hypothetical protein